MTNKTQNEEEKDKEESLSEVVENSIDLIDSDTPSSIVDTITDGADLIGEAIGAITSIFN